MFSTQEHRDEAARLLSLNDSALVVESVALALRIGDGSSKAAQMLHDLDVRTVESLFDARTVPDRQADRGDAE